MGWQSADFSHAYFILPISLYIIWSKKAALHKSTDWHFAGTLPFVLGLLLYVYAAVNAFMFLEAAAFVLVFWGILRLCFTQDSFSLLVFPIAYLVFLIPPPSILIDWITFPLKQIAAQGSYAVLNVMHIPVELYGVILKVADHELFIADACSGFRSIVTLMSLSAVWVYVQDTSIVKKWTIFIATLPIAVLANIFRICLTGLIANYWGHEMAEGFFHDFSGLVLFAITTLCLVGLTQLLLHQDAKRGVR